jgi:RNA polymerase sigma factor (sigma-70 family)
MVCDPVRKTPHSGRTRRARPIRPVRPAADSAPQPVPQVETEALGQAARGRALLESQYELIQKKLQVMGRHSGLPEHEAEELRSWALFKLVEDDYRILGRWEGRSSFATYLTVVLVNLTRDYRIHVWGKWRPSAAAQRLGEEAVLLEQLTVRDGLPLEEAIYRMRIEKGVSTPAAGLEALALKLPPRSGRRQVDDGELVWLPVDGQVEARLVDGERARAAARVRDVLPALFRELPAEDRLLLQLHYRNDLSMAAISPLLGIPQRELYSRRDRCLKKLRRALEQTGLDACGLRVLFAEHA